MKLKHLLLVACFSFILTPFAMAESTTDLLLKSTVESYCYMMNF